jgi:hypothetical protein
MNDLRNDIIILIVVTDQDHRLSRNLVIDRDEPKCEY